MPVECAAVEQVGDRRPDLDLGRRDFQDEHCCRRHRPHVRIEVVPPLHHPSIRVEGRRGGCRLQRQRPVGQRQLRHPVEAAARRRRLERPDDRPAVVAGRHIAARHRQVGDRPRLRRVDRQAGGKGQTVRRAPDHPLQRQYRIARRAQQIQRPVRQPDGVDGILGVLDRLDPHDLAMRRIGVRRCAGDDPQHLLDQQIVADRQLRPVGILVPAARRQPVEPRLGGAARQAALGVAPGVEAQFVVIRIDGGARRRLEHAYRLQRLVRLEVEQAGRDHRSGCGRLAAQRSRDPGQQPRPLRHHPGPVGLELHEGPRVAPVMDAIVDQPRVTLGRDAVPRRVEIGLGRDGVLEIGEMVAGIGEQLDQRHPEVGRVALQPARVALRDQVEQQPAKTLIVLGEIVDQRFRHRLRRAVRIGAAVEIRRARGLEAEGCRGELRIHVRMHHRQQVGGEVARPVDEDVQPQRLHRVRHDVEHRDADDARAAADGEAARAADQGSRRRLQERRLDPMLLAGRGRVVLEIFDEVEPVERARMIDDVAPAAIVAAPHQP